MLRGNTVGLFCGLFALLSGITFVVDSVIGLFAAFKVRQSPLVVGLPSLVSLPAVADLRSVVRLAAPVGLPVLGMFLSGW
jgi:hypothetical protein